jgi:anti-sigma B factor antagonist
MRPWWSGAWVVSVMAGQPFEVRIIGGVPVVSAPEEIDISNAGDFRAAFQSAAGHPTIVADLSATEYCDSSGLNVLVRALRRVQEQGGELRLVARTSAVLRILNVTGVGKLLKVYASVEDALADRAPTFAPTW